MAYDDLRMLSPMNIQFLRFCNQMFIVVCVTLFIFQGVQIGMGPGGELRYPSLSSQKLNMAWSRELGEFQCYDKVG